MSKDGQVSLGGRSYIAAEILGGMLISIRIEQNTMMFFDPATRVLHAPGLAARSHKVRVHPWQIPDELESPVRGPRRAHPPEAGRSGTGRGRVIRS